MRNVNLYQPEARSGLQSPSRNLLLGLLLTLSAGVLLDSGWQLRQLQQGRQALDEASSQLASHEQALQQAREQAQQPSREDELRQQLVQTEEENRQLDWLARQVSQLRTQHSAGFSPLLDAMAERHVPGLWLDRLYFAEGGQQLRFEGLLGRPELLPAWLESLGRSERLDGRDFAQLQMQRDGQGRLHFVLASHAEEE